jgi:uncharacterized lipoprotein YmbA
MKKLSLIFMLFLAGCASSTITGKTYQPVAENEVRVWFASRPNCELEEIGFLSVPYAIGQSMMVSALKKEGAAIGAQHVLVTAVNSNKNLEYSGGAMAARCR